MVVNGTETLKLKPYTLDMYEIVKFTVDFTKKS